MTENEKNIIKGLKCCSLNDSSACKDCPYKSGDNCFDMCKGAYELIERLSAELAAAKRDLKHVLSNSPKFEGCAMCKHRDASGECFVKCKFTPTEWAWEWRGLCEDNGGTNNEG